MTKREFENLLLYDDPIRKIQKRIYGNFGFKEAVHKQQIEGRDGKGLQVGDTVFYLKVKKVDNPMRGRFSSRMPCNYNSRRNHRGVRLWK